MPKLSGLGTGAIGYPLLDAIIEEIKRVANRVEIRFDEATFEGLPAAALAESPIYRGGEQLLTWLRSFVTPREYSLPPQNTLR